MIVAELQNRRKLLVVTILCAAHALDNCSIWGLGDFPFGSLLRAAHLFEARRLAGLGEYVSAVLRPGIGPDSPSTALPLKSTSVLLLSNMSFPRRQRFTPCRSRERRNSTRVWRVKGSANTQVEREEKLGPFTAINHGRGGPFQIQGHKSRSKEAALLCDQLRPFGVPNMGDVWDCAPGCTKSDYVDALRLIFGKKHADTYFISIV